jgi:hypothetical protein
MTAKNKVNAKAITSDQLEKMFDNGDDILDYVDMSNPVVEHHPPLEKRITLTMPAWMVSEPPIWRSAATPSSTHGSPTGCAPRDAAKRSTPSP